MSQVDACSSRRLEEILRSLPPGELDALIARLGVTVVAAKRIDPASQVARALVSLPEVRDTARLPPASSELLHRIAEARGSLIVPSLPPGLEPLAARGIVFARMRTPGCKASAFGGSIELILPHAYLVQLRSWESEDPRGVRALLAQAPFETASAIATHYLGRPATPPIALSLETAWEQLSDPEGIARELARLSPVERRLLEAIEREGGEVDTEELLDLEREPLRLRGAGGATASRRGIGFALERRGLLVPVHPNRHLVPTEVMAEVGSADRAARDERREQIRGVVLDVDHAPRRARFADTPVPLAMALALAMREPGGEVRPGVGTPKSLLSRLSIRFGRDVEAVALISALSRAIGLWDPAALSPATPPGSLSLQELESTLYDTWKRGGAWDEARPEPEVLRIAGDARDGSPIGVIRELVIDALRELGEGRWVPWGAVSSYVRDDQRSVGVARLLRRWADRCSIDPLSPIEVARRIALQSLPALGVVDLGVELEDILTDPSSPADPQSSTRGASLRLTPRGRALMNGKVPTTEPVASRFLDNQVLRVGPQTRINAVLALGPLVEIGKLGEQIDLILTPPSLARALSAGVESEMIRGRIESVAPLPDGLSRLIAQASIVVGKGAFVAGAGFLWIEDPNVREILRTRKQTSDLFVDPSPEGGLLVHPGIDVERLTRRCRSLGVEVTVDGMTVRTRSSNSVPPPGTPIPSRARPARPREA